MLILSYALNSGVHLLTRLYGSLKLYDVFRGKNYTGTIHDISTSRSSSCVCEVCGILYNIIITKT